MTGGGGGGGDANLTVLAQLQTLTINRRGSWLAMMGAPLVKPLIQHYLTQLPNIDEAAADSFPGNSSG